MPTLNEHHSSNDIPIETLREKFSYDPTAGTITRLKGQKDVVGLSRTKGKILISRNELREFSRVAWALHYGQWPDGLVDHKDGDPTNNRINNLRLATRSQNNCNRIGIGVYPKGVWMDSRGALRNPWRARIQVNGRIIRLGCFHTMEEAAAAYRTAAMKLHGEFAWTEHSR